MLLSHRANVNAFDSLNRTPLHIAAIKGKKEIAELLLSHGANIVCPTVRLAQRSI